MYNLGYDSDTKVVLETNENHIITSVIEVIENANNRTNYAWNKIPNIIGKEVEEALDIWQERLDSLDTEYPSYVCIYTDEEFIQKELDKADYWFYRDQESLIPIPKKINRLNSITL